MWANNMTTAQGLFRNLMIGETREAVAVRIRRLVRSEISAPLEKHLAEAELPAFSKK